MHNLKFGDYCIIEQKRYGCENEQFLYKVVGELRSSAWVEVPVKCGEGEQNHGVMQDVYLCICCGVDETKVEKFRKIDCKQNQMFKDSPLRKEIDELLNNIRTERTLNLDAEKRIKELESGMKDAYDLVLSIKNSRVGNAGDHFVYCPGNFNKLRVDELSKTLKKHLNKNTAA